MQVVIFIGFIVFAVAFATIIQQRFLKRISVNYIAMAIGAAIALVPQTNSLIEDFSSELFMGLIVAPLLFFEGQRTRLYNVLRSWRAIVGLTVIMIILATITAGFGIYFSMGLYTIGFYSGCNFNANRCYSNRICNTWIEAA